MKIPTIKISGLDNWQFDYASPSRFAKLKVNGDKVEFPPFYLIHSCREQFHARGFNNHNHKNVDTILFTHNDGEFVKIRNFISDIEDILGIEAQAKSKAFIATGKDNILVLKVSPFWLFNGIRRQLLTILMRAGRNYSKPKTGSNSDAIQAALKSYEYSDVTINTINYFLEGNTALSPDQASSGWMRKFCNRTGYQKYKERPMEKVRKILVKP